MSNAKIFTDIYSFGRWAGDPLDRFNSGVGSWVPHFVDDYISAVNSFVSSLDFRPSAFDLGCGNFLVGGKLRHLFEPYYASDVVEYIIENNKNFYKDLNVIFSVLDAELDELPDADIVIVRQVFQHLSNESISAILPKLKKYKYAIVTEHIPSDNFTPNLNKPVGPEIRFPNSGVVISEPPFEFEYLDKSTICVIYDVDWGGMLVTTVYKLRE